jgi:hypothetical protein
MTQKTFYFEFLPNRVNIVGKPSKILESVTRATVVIIPHH